MNQLTKILVMDQSGGTLWIEIDSVKQQHTIWEVI